MLSIFISNKVFRLQTDSKSLLKLLSIIRLADPLKFDSVSKNK